MQTGKCIISSKQAGTYWLRAWNHAPGLHPSSIHTSFVTWPGDLISGGVNHNAYLKVTMKSK